MKKHTLLSFVLLVTFAVQQAQGQIETGFLVEQTTSSSPGALASTLHLDIPSDFYRRGVEWSEREVVNVINFGDVPSGLNTHGFRGVEWDQRYFVDEGHDAIAVNAYGVLLIERPGVYTFGSYGDGGGTFTIRDKDGFWLPDSRLWFDADFASVDESIGYFNFTEPGAYRITASYYAPGSTTSSWELYGEDGIHSSLEGMPLLGDFTAGGIAVFPGFEAPNIFAPSATIPEPSSFALAFFALVPLGLMRQRRQA